MEKFGPKPDISGLEVKINTVFEVRGRKYFARA